MAHGRSYWELPFGESLSVAETKGDQQKLQTPSDQGFNITSECVMKFIEQQKESHEE